MKAIIFKELRENLRWAGLILLVTFGLLTLGINQERNTGIPFLEKTVLIISLLIYPAAGLFLGLVQIFQDARKGRWQFITHRPASRSRVFLCKVIAGMVLYAVATLLPLMFTAIWVATPGHVPGPFSLDMLQPVLSLLMSGIVWYGVGLLVAARKARWFGSRIMPVGIAIAGMFAAFLFAMTFAEAAGIAILCAGMLFSAAWGAFVGGGDSSLISGWAKPSIGMVVAIGWIMTVLVGMGCAAAAIETLSVKKRVTVWYPGYRMNADGDLVAYHHNDLTNKAGMELLAANVRLKDDSDRNWVTRVQAEGFLNPDSHMRLLGGVWAGSWSSGKRPENWIYVVSRQILEGYDYESRRLVASIGRDGFVAAGEPVRPFPEPLRTASKFDAEAIFISQDTVFGLDPDRRQIFKIFSATPGDSVLDAKWIASSNKPEVQGPPDQRDYVVVTREGIHIIQGTHSLVTVPVEPELLGSYYVVVARNRAGNIVVASGLYSSFEPHHAFVYGLDGHLIRRTDKPADPYPPHLPEPAWEEWATVAPVPPAIFAATYAMELLYSKPFEWLPFLRLLVVIPAYLSIALSMLRARHASRGQFIIWLFVVAPLGLSGILLLMSMFEKPKSLRCPSCGKRRLVTESACPSCRTPAAAPMMEGIEIFEPMAAIATG